MDESMSLPQKSNKAAGIWLAILLLLLLIVASSLLLYSILADFSKAGEVNVIALVPNTTGEGDAPELTLGEDGETWETSTEMNLFAATYLAPDGTVTVESADKTPVIAPGTGNRFEFSLKNTGNVTMEYTMIPTGTFMLADQVLPIEIRLTSGDEYLIGDENTWRSVSTLSSVKIKGTLERDHYATYALEWRWPYEADTESQKLLQDLQDTMLAEVTMDQKLDFTLGINTVSTIPTGAIPTTNNGMILLSEMLAPEILYPFLAMVCLLCLLVLLLILFAPPMAIPVDVEEPIPAPAPEPAPTVVPRGIPLRKNNATLSILSSNAVYVDRRDQAVITLETIAKYYAVGDTVTMASLRAKGLIGDHIKSVKILAPDGQTANLLLLSNGFVVKSALALSENYKPQKGSATEAKEPKVMAPPPAGKRVAYRQPEAPKKTPGMSPATQKPRVDVKAPKSGVDPAETQTVKGTGTQFKADLSNGSNVVFDISIPADKKQPKQDHKK